MSAPLRSLVSGHESAESRNWEALKLLRDAHRPDRFRPKMARAPWVYVPAQLALLPSDGDGCRNRCLACRLVGERGVETSPRAVRELTHGRGLPLHLVLVILRYARPYSLTPTGEGDARFVFNASERLSIADLTERVRGAGMYGGTDQAQRAVRRALHLLERRRFIEIIDDPGHPSFYIPHALHSLGRIPQHFWRQGPFSGAATLLLLHLLARTHMPLEDLVGRRRLPGDLSVLDDHARWAHDYALADTLPFSPNVRREALRTLEEAGLVQIFETGGKRFILLVEPG